SGVAQQVIDATHGVVGDTLLASSISLALVLAIACGLGGLRARDLGLSKRGAVVGAIATLACWGLAQVVLVVAALASGGGLAAAAVFGASHIPIRLAYSELRVGELAWLAWNGLMLELIYMRTGHLEVCVGFHALWNAPLALVASPVPANQLMLAIQVAII